MPSSSFGCYFQFGFMPSKREYSVCRPETG
jgi:hypothetical protein